MLNLAEWGMYEQDDVLIQPFQNGKAMHVRLAEDKVDVRTRQVPIERASDTGSALPEWFTAYDLILAEWMRSNSPVWQWLQLKGIDEAAVVKRLMKRN
jgi:hypothetical protein